MSDCRLDTGAAAVTIDWTNLRIPRELKTRINRYIRHDISAHDVVAAALELLEAKAPADQVREAKDLRQGRQSGK